MKAAGTRFPGCRPLPCGFFAVESATGSPRPRAVAKKHHVHLHGRALSHGRVGRLFRPVACSLLELPLPVDKPPVLRQGVSTFLL